MHLAGSTPKSYTHPGPANLAGATSRLAITLSACIRKAEGGTPMNQLKPIERNLAMELVRVTEAAAMSAALHMGKGDKELLDGAAVDAMRHTLEGIRMDGIV